MYELIVENYRGEQLQLVPNPNYYVEVDGLTGGTAAINTAVAGNSAGSHFNSSRAEEGDMSLSIMPRGNIEKNRIELYRYFKRGKFVKIFYKNSMRDVYKEGYVEQSPSGSLFSEKETMEISIVCPQPYWQSTSQNVTDISDVTPYFVFPFAIEEAIPFSQLEKGVEKTVFNNGDVESGIIIELQADGAVSDIVIYDAFGGSFAVNYPMEEGDRITINTYEGQKRMILLKDGVESNVFKYVGDNPTWFVLEPGDNVFIISATGSENLQVRYYNYNLYEGV